MLFVLSADNQLEIFKVNVNKPEAILKKMVRAEKKRSLKRTHKEFAAAQQSDSEEGAGGAPAKRTVDKAALQK